MFRDWHHLQLAFAIGSLSLISYFFLIPESPRWLVHKGRIHEAQELLCTLAKKNGVDIKRTKFQDYFDALQTQKSRENISVQKSFSDYIVKAKIVATNREYVKRVLLLIPPFFAVGVA